MLILSSRSNTGRASLVCLALVGYLLAVGAPLLHAAAHSAHEESGPARHNPDRVAHSHDAIHAPSLHDECLGPTRSIMRVALARLQPTVELDLPTPDRTVTLRPARIWGSRAPPASDPARAPPHI